VETELGLGVPAAAKRGGEPLPYLRIETDYSPSDSGRIAVRVEALFETVRAGAGACAQAPAKSAAEAAPSKGGGRCCSGS